jgi:hypothetical protein
MLFSEEKSIFIFIFQLISDDSYFFVVVMDNTWWMTGQYILS